MGAKGFVHVSTLKCNFTTGIAVFIFYIEAMALQFVEKFMSYQKIKNARSKGDHFLLRFTSGRLLSFHFSF